jgi:hypothetical protein
METDGTLLALRLVATVLMVVAGVFVGCLVLLIGAHRGLLF